MNVIGICFCCNKEICEGESSIDSPYLTHAKCFDYLVEKVSEYKEKKMDNSSLSDDESISLYDSITFK